MAVSHASKCRPSRPAGFVPLARAGLCAALVLAGVAGALAQERQGGPSHQQAQGNVQGNVQANVQGSVLRLLPGDSVTEHTITTSSGPLAYTATAGTLALYDESGERSASVFYTAYVAKDADKRTRPLTFVFNGGPGAASAYLHLGLVGPRILVFAGNPGDPAAARLQDNPDTWLAFTDLVMIDPVSTGWSRAAKPDGAKAFWGVRQDADAIAKVIALYVANNGRLASPKYLLGESYGGFRAPKVARAVQREQGIGISGILMVSPMLDGWLQFGGERLALGAALHLPSAVAAQLDRTHSFSEQALADAEHFALGEYLTTLAGPEPTGPGAQAFYAKVAQMTGVPQDVVARGRGFIDGDYFKQVRASEHQVVSPYDATFAIPDPFPEASGRNVDPILDGFTRSFGGAFVSYAREELGFKTEMTYELLNGEISGKWDWDDHGGRSQPSVAEDLRVLLAMDPNFHLLIGQGRSDLVTPYAANRYILDHIPRNVAGSRAVLKLYPGGHMIYVDPASRKAFTADARAFYQAAASPAE